MGKHGYVVGLSNDDYANGVFWPLEGCECRLTCFLWLLALR